jgi:putative transcriptional regulator
MIPRVIALYLILATVTFSAPPVHPGFSKQPEPAGGSFLVASEYFMKDPLFAESVILMIKHDEDGSFGLILNHPSKLTISQAIPQVGAPVHVGNPVSIGGPVSPRQFFMLVRTNVKEDGLFAVMDQVAFSAKSDSIQQWLSRENGRQKIRLFAGYSGWASGQLDAEIQLGAWGVLPASAKTVFESEPADLWRMLTAHLTGHEET